jgi:hypothetical protein
MSMRISGGNLRLFEDRRGASVRRHMRDNFFVVGEGILTTDERGKPVTERPSTTADLRKFRFSRLGPPNGPDPAELGAEEETLNTALAEAMVATPSPDSDGTPAGFTYLGQFVDHDLTMDATATAFGTDVNVEDLVQGRSPALDLDSLYGRGPQDGNDQRFYQADKAKLRVGTTVGIAFQNDPFAAQDMEGFDLPRVGQGSTKGARRMADIPDHRNDENLIVAQMHAAFIRFHNRVVDQLSAAGTPSAALFEKARKKVVRHYQWMLRHDFLPRVVDPSIVDDVFTNGRKFFEVPWGENAPGDRHVKPGDAPTMPIEFSVAAYRLGHSMVRGAYNWNKFFKVDTQPPASLALLFQFTGTSGILSPDGNLDDPESGSLERLPSNWIADFRRLVDFTEAGRADLAGPGVNLTKRIDTLLVDPLKQLPEGSFGDRGAAPGSIRRNLAFRNLTRANMVNLASGQQMAQFLEVKPLSAEEIIGNGLDGAVLTGLDDGLRQRLTTNTPLWFYILREAEQNNGKLGPVGGRIVAEVFHRAIEGSRVSILRRPSWRPDLGPDENTFRLVDLVLFAFEGDVNLINPLQGD